MSKEENKKSNTASPGDAKEKKGKPSEKKAYRVAVRINKIVTVNADSMRNIFDALGERKIAEVITRQDISILGD